jgi:hypothetical protein
LQIKPKKVNLDELSGLERYPIPKMNPSSKSKAPDSNFIITKAVNMDNLPEKAQAKQKKQILNKVIDDRYVADHYYP